MKKLSSLDLLKLLTPLPQERFETCKKAVMLSELGFDAQRLERMTAEGFFDCVLVTWDGVPQYQVYYHHTPDGGLYVNWALQLIPTPIFETLSVALDQLAAAKACSYIVFTTRRPGLVAKGEKFGYKALSVVMTKTL